MNSPSKLPACLAALLAVVLPLNLFAQKVPEPAAVIAIASIDEQISDVEYIAGAMSENMGRMSGMLRTLAPSSMPGIDFSKPAGAMLYFVEGQMEPKAVGFLPVKDADALLDYIARFADMDEDGETITIVPDNGEEVTVINKGEYFFVSDSPEMLKDLPADPASLVSGLTSKYNLSANIFPLRVPENLRGELIGFLRENFEQGLEQLEDTDLELQKTQVEMQIKQIESLINDVDIITAGFDANSKKEEIIFEFEMKGAAGSDFQKKIVQSKANTDSLFTGFLADKAAVTFHSCSGISEEDAEITMKSLEAFREAFLNEIGEEADEKVAKLAGDVSTKLLDVLKKTMDSGSMDMGGMVSTEGGLNAVMGAKVVGASDLEKSIKKVVAEIEAEIEEDEIVFNLNSGSHKGFNLHEVLVNPDLDEIDEAVVELLGEQIKFVLAIGNDQFYVALGKDAVNTLTKSIDANAGGAKQAELLGQYNIFVAPIMDMVADVSQGEEMTELLRDRINELGRDRVRVTWDVVEGSIRGRVEIQDGILGMFGTFAEMMSGLGAGGADF